MTDGQSYVRECQLHDEREQAERAAMQPATVRSHPGSLIYLACPYSHPESMVCESRFNAVNRAAAMLMSQGKHVFSPISHTHPIAEAGQLPLGWDYWEQYDRVMLAASAEVVVLMLDGWQESKGVQAEIAIAREMGLPVTYLHPHTFADLAQRAE